MIRFSVSRLLQAPSGPPGCALTPRASISPFRCNQATGQRGLWPELGCIGSSKSFSTQARSRSKSFEEYRKTAGLKKQEDFIRLDKANCSPNYLPTPVVISRGEGVYVWDTEGNKYFDFVCGISSLNQGHCHPRITAALKAQADRLTLTSRALHNDCMSVFCKFLNELFGYQRTLLMNTGAEAGETAVKMARKWGYEVKGLKKDSAKIIFCNNNYWGRTIAAASSSTTLENYRHFGPFTPGFELIPYDDLQALEKALQDPQVAAFFVEPIQGEAGVVVPQRGYLRAAAELCREHNVLLIADEIQAGLGRSGKLLACDWDYVRPDVVLLGKSISGGVLPCSAVITDAHIMQVFSPGTHGSTFGGNPLACAVGYEALSVLLEEGMLENSCIQGELLRSELQRLKDKHKLHFIKDIRGKGLFNAVEIDGSSGECMHLCMQLKEEGLLCRPTRGTVLRFLPPLNITEEQMKEAIERIAKVFLRKTS